MVLSVKTEDQQTAKCKAVRLQDCLKVKLNLKSDKYENTNKQSVLLLYADMYPILTNFRQHNIARDLMNFRKQT